MFREQFATMESSVRTLERFGHRIESALTRNRWASVWLLSSVFLACASMKARRGMFWFDEVLTFYIAALPSFSAIWKALIAHAESGSPYFTWSPSCRATRSAGPCSACAPRRSWVISP